MPTCIVCNKNRRGLDSNNACKECRVLDTNTADNSVQITVSEDSSDIPALPEDWMRKPLNELLGGHLMILINKNAKLVEDALRDQGKRVKVLEANYALNEAHKTLEKEKEKLKQRLIISETKVTNLEKNESTVKDILNKQHSYIVKCDKLKRLKNVIIGGLPENGDLQFDNKNAFTDNEKVNLILQAIGKEEIKSVHCRRIGNEDQGPNKRARYLLVEFSNQSDRNTVRNASSELKNVEVMKNIFIKGDLTKEEREEYKRLYTEKNILAENNPEVDVRVEKGKLYVGDDLVDQIKTSSKIF